MKPFISNIENKELRISAYYDREIKPSYELLDEIVKLKGIKKVWIMYFKQELFNFFITKYGDKLKNLVIHHCGRLSDLTLLESLTKIESVQINWNIKSPTLWNQSNNIKLKRIEFNDFSKIKSLKNLINAPNITELSFGNRIHSKFVIDSLKHLEKIETLKVLSFNFNKITNDGIIPLARMKHLEEINFPIGSFEIEVICWLKSKLTGKALKNMYDATEPMEMEFDGKKLDTMIVGKRGRWLNSKKDSKLIEKKINKYNRYLEWFINNPKAKPEDVKRAGI